MNDRSQAFRQRVFEADDLHRGGAKLEPWGAGPCSLAESLPISTRTSAVDGRLGYLLIRHEQKAHCLWNFISAGVSPSLAPVTDDTVRLNPLVTTSPQLPARFLVAAVCGCAAVVFPLGCRGRAQRDVYLQKMASEIRVLEDQLYEADYENKLLAEKLERARSLAAEAAEEALDQRREPGPYGPPEIDAGAKFEDSPDLAVPPEIEGPSGPERPAGDEIRRPPANLPLEDPRDESPFLDDIDIGDPEVPPPDSPPSDRPDPAAPPDGQDLLPAPGGPVPPGPDDLRIPPIEEGDIIPPPSPDEAPDDPPGQIVLPEGVNLFGQSTDASSGSQPHSLMLHPSLSGGQQLDEQPGTDGMILVVTVVDDAGQPVDLDGFQVQAALTIVALDPTRKPSEARIGHWEFAADEVQSLVHSKPISGLHVPVRWTDELPLGDEVVVHVRLKSADEEMQCEGTVRIDGEAKVAQWMPRGDSETR